MYPPPHPLPPRVRPYDAHMWGYTDEIDLSWDRCWKYLDHDPDIVLREERLEQALRYGRDNDLVHIFSSRTVER